MSHKILIIEDEPDIRKTLEYNISREGYKVVCASSLSEGKEQINSSDFSLILLSTLIAFSSSPFPKNSKLSTK